MIGSDMKKRLLTVNEVAKLLRKRPETVRRWISAGRLPVIRKGFYVLVPFSAAKVIEAHVCEHCDTVFKPIRPLRNPRYCSDKCRWAATYERRKTEQPTTRRPIRPPKEQGKRSARIAAPARLRAAVDFVRQKTTP
jgi:excisionase family DNA binding protein